MGGGGGAPITREGGGGILHGGGAGGAGGCGMAVVVEGGDGSRLSEDCFSEIPEEEEDDVEVIRTSFCLPVWVFVMYIFIMVKNINVSLNKQVKT